ncbi:hypothetical protein NEOC65_000764 [Neochlamydia sp. AcF65]|nr:hypothetical protein [Neochlamydia sp. AcF65]
MVSYIKNLIDYLISFSSFFFLNFKPSSVQKMSAFKLLSISKAPMKK